MCSQWIIETAMKMVILMIPWLTYAEFNVVETEKKTGALKHSFAGNTGNWWLSRETGVIQRRLVWFHS